MSEEHRPGPPGGPRAGDAGEASAEAPLGPEARARLEAWKVPGAPAGFAERVAAAWAREGTADASVEVRAVDVTAPRRRWLRAWVVAAAAALVLLAGGGALLAVRSLGGGVASAGVHDFSARAELAIGARAVAVGEAGAALSWSVEPSGAARVDQPKGDVFYRVDAGGPFLVATPAGEVTVRGTCFRLEVRPMGLGISKSTAKGAAVGAALAVLATVIVYEGRVLLANERGETEIAAGETASVASGGAPGAASAARAEAGAGTAAGSAAAALLEPPRAGATLEELLMRDAALRRELALLRARVGALEEEDGERAAGKGGPPAHEGSFFEPSKEELLKMAERCELRWDVPPLEAEPRGPDPDELARLGIRDTELPVLRAAHEEFHRWLMTELRALYVEATGDTAGAGSLSAVALGNEIMDKSIPGERRDLQRLLAAERAGLAAPPAELAGTTPLERHMRLMASLGDEYESRLAGVIGPDRAHALRAAGDGWPSHWKTSGCSKP